MAGVQRLVYTRRPNRGGDWESSTATGIKLFHSIPVSLCYRVTEDNKRTGVRERGQNRRIVQSWQAIVAVWTCAKRCRGMNGQKQVNVPFKKSIKIIGEQIRKRKEGLRKEGSQTRNLMIDRDAPWQCLAALGGISWQQRRTEKRYGGRSCRAISRTNLPRHLFWDFSGLTCPSLIRGRESESCLSTALYALRAPIPVQFHRRTRMTWANDRSFRFLVTLL